MLPVVDGMKADHSCFALRRGIANESEMELISVKCNEAR